MEGKNAEIVISIGSLNTVMTRERI